MTVKIILTIKDLCYSEETLLNFSVNGFTKIGYILLFIPFKQDELRIDDLLTPTLLLEEI
jgi:hypothetical protein